MTDWAQDLNQFLDDKGIKQSSPEFNQSEEKEIQKFLDETNSRTQPSLKSYYISFKLQARTPNIVPNTCDKITRMLPRNPINPAT